MSTYIRTDDVLSHLLQIFTHLVIFPVFKKQKKHLCIVLHVMLHGTDLIVCIGGAFKISGLGFDQFFIDAVHLSQIVPFLSGNSYVKNKGDKCQCGKHQNNTNRFVHRKDIIFSKLLRHEHGEDVQKQAEAYDDRKRQGNIIPLPSHSCYKIKQKKFHKYGGKGIHCLCEHKL